MSHKTLYWIITIIIIAVLALFFFLGQGAAPTAELEKEGAEEVGSAEEITTGMRVGENVVYASDVEPGADVRVTTLVIKDGGYVVVHASGDGTPGAILGASEYLEPGEHNDVLVSLSSPIEEGDKFFAMLHKDNGDKKFSAADDKPVLSEESNPLMMEFSVRTDTVLNVPVNL